MSKGIDELKDWAMHNVRLISILPSNKNLPVDTKLTDVLEPDVDEKYFLSEERTAQLLKEFPRDLPDGVDGFNKADGDVSYALTTRTSQNYLPTHIEKAKATLVSVNIIPVLTPDRIEKRQNGRRFKEDGEPMFTLTSQDRHGVALSGLYTNASKDFQRPPLKGLSRTLKANKADAAITDGFRIRKLTPLECFRLQGFTDDQFHKAKNAGVSDSQLYKQAGNSVTVNVIDAIARRL